VARILVTRTMPEGGLAPLERAGHELVQRGDDTPYSHDELVAEVADVDAVVCLLTDRIDEAVLRRAGIEGADCFVSVTNGDNRNLMAAQIAQRIFKVKRVITRLYDPIRESVYREMGLETFCPTTLGADLIREYFLDGVNRGRDASGVDVPVVRAS